MQPKTYFTPAEYLALEIESERRHEYWDGRIIEREDVSWEHALIASRLITLLTDLDGSRVALTSLMRVCLPEDRYVYPDVSVLCGEPELTQGRPESLLNPTALIEIAPGTTSVFDRSTKLSAYVTVPSLREYWIVEETTPQVTRYVRHDIEWLLFIESGPGTVIRSVHLGVEIALDEIYR